MGGIQRPSDSVNRVLGHNKKLNNRFDDDNNHDYDHYCNEIEGLPMMNDPEWSLDEAN